jgi:glucosamine--fructose-6-phosphate aminotransferase (isomerizing)
MASDRFLAEILGQPAALRRAGAVLAEQRDALAGLAGVAAAVRAAGRVPLVLATGMGGSLNACRAVVPVLVASGLAAFEVETAELVNTRRGLLERADLVILVSQSGRSAEALRLAALLDAPGGPALCAVTNLGPSPLGERAGIVLETRAGPEESPSTASFTTCLVALGAIAATLAGEPIDAVLSRAAAAADGAAAAVAEQLHDHEERARALRAWLGPRPHLFVLGRGAAGAAAGMGALLLKEATAIHAESMSGAEFRHGPLELAGPGIAAAIVALEPGTIAFDAELAADLRVAGSPVAWVGPAGSAPPGTFACAVATLDAPAGVAPAVVPFQLLAQRLAGEREAAGTFRWAGKVTTKE